jgi:hypothetical protein
VIPDPFSDHGGDGFCFLIEHDGDPKYSLITRSSDGQMLCALFAVEGGASLSARSRALRSEKEQGGPPLFHPKRLKETRGAMMHP